MRHNAFKTRPRGSEERFFGQAKAEPAKFEAECATN